MGRSVGRQGQQHKRRLNTVRKGGNYTFTAKVIYANPEICGFSRILQKCTFEMLPFFAYSDYMKEGVKGISKRPHFTFPKKTETRKYMRLLLKQIGDVDVSESENNEILFTALSKDTNKLTIKLLDGLTYDATYFIEFDNEEDMQEFEDGMQLTYFISGIAERKLNLPNTTLNHISLPPCPPNMSDEEWRSQLESANLRCELNGQTIPYPALSTKPIFDTRTGEPLNDAAKLIVAARSTIRQTTRSNLITSI